MLAVDENKNDNAISGAFQAWKTVDRLFERECEDELFRVKNILTFHTVLPPTSHILHGKSLAIAE